MRLSDFQKIQERDKIEITKQQQAEIQKVRRCGRQHKFQHTAV